MKWRQTGDRFFVYVQKDEAVLETLTAFCRDHDICCGQVSGIGALQDIELGAFDPATREYARRRFPGDWELVSCQGNITLKDGQSFIHAHVTIGDPAGDLKGGHLFEARVAVVGEFIIQTFKDEVHRTLDPDIGLATWSL